MVPRKRLELLHREATASKTVVSTNSTTWAKVYLFMVGREGFEPPKAKPKDLQSSPFDHSGTDPYKKRI